MSLDMSVTFTVPNKGPKAGKAAQAVGFILRAWKSGGEGSAVFLYDFTTKELTAVFEALDPDTLQPTLDSDRWGKGSGRRGEGVRLMFLITFPIMFRMMSC